jgi:hypothetical protein
MDGRESAFRKSWLPTAKLISVGVVVTAISIPVFIAGLSGGNLLLLILGAAMAVSGPLLLVILPFMKRGGYGACPVCKTSIEAFDGGAHDLLCGGCGSYLDVEGDRLVTIAHHRLHEVPLFAVPTPWPDIRNVISSTVALSAPDYLSSAVTDAIMTDKGAHVMDPRWPPGCCVCAAPTTRNDQFALKVRMAGNIRDSQAELIVRDVPYCDQHQEGIDFHSVTFASRGHDREFAMRFRSHAFREAFRELNPWAWDCMKPWPVAGAVPPPIPEVFLAAKVVIRCPRCLQQLRVATGRTGTIKCPKCGEPFEATT